MEKCGRQRFVSFWPIPKAWNHKLVEVTGIASHGFEDSSFSDPFCGSRYGGLWMEYGGKARTGTMSTVSDWSRTRPESLVVEGVSVPLADDEVFHRFDQLLHEGHGNLVHARVVARFFAGRQNVYGHGGWGGFGHLGCCSLFVIQQVAWVDDARSPDLDYAGEAAQPQIDCYRFLTPTTNEMAEREAQKLAETGGRGYAFSDPDRVTREEVMLRAHIAEAGRVKLERVSSTAGRIVYQAAVSESKVSYTLTLSRPYWLSLEAANRNKVAWVVLATVASCDVVPGDGGTVERLK